jgi:hypothetical protein
MAGNIDVGLGLGLQAQLQAPAQVFARQQQQKVMAQQAAMKRAAEDEDLLARLQKDVSVNSKDLHRLLKEPIANMTAAAINELIKAKSSGEVNWRNKAVDITNDYRNQIAHLSGLSEQYKNFEKNYEMMGNYKTREQQGLRELMNGSQTYTEMLEKAKAKGIGGVDVESGLLTSNQFMPRVDLNRTLDNTFSKVSPVNVDIKMIKEGGKDIEQVTTRVPLMEDEASLIAQQRGLTFVPSIQSTAREIVADPVLRSQYADQYNINPQDEAALMTSIMNEGRKFVEEGVKRKYLSNPNIKVYVNTGAEQDVLGFNKSVQDLDTGGFKTASAAVLGVNAPGYSTVSSKNLVDQTGKPVVGGTLSDIEVNEVRVLPYVKSENGVIKPAAKGEKSKVQGYKPFVMFGKAGSKFFLPAEEFSYTGLMKGGKDISMTIQNSVSEMNAYADKLNETYIAERKKEGAIKNAFASGDVYTLTNELKNKINNGQ